jgi:hypothetical protein
MNIEWQFGGWLRALPAPAAWAILAAVALGGAWLIARLYLRTLRKLPPAARIALVALRAAILLAVLVCLANPQRERSVSPEKSGRELSVLVDRSESMSMPDHRGATRLAEAVRRWKNHEAEARAAFDDISDFRFATTMHPARGLDDAVATAQPAADETHLYASLREALAQSPAAIACLTDGLDTTTDDAVALVAEAQRRGVPLYFAVGQNRLRSGEMLNIREVKAPPRVLRRTEFTASALIEVAGTAEADVPVELWSGAEKLASTSLPMRPGRNTVAWPVTVTAREPGAMPLEFRVGAGERQQVATCTTQVVEREKVDVLYYQGALQWGYRYLLAALESDPSFRLESILNPALGVHLGSNAGGASALVDLPENADALRRFQIVVLAHVFADRLTPGQQKALVEYARKGGAVIFIAPDTEAVSRFAGTEIERMLPMTFDATATGAQPDAAERFRMQMLNSGADVDRSDPSSDSSERKQALPPLQAFALPPGGERSITAALFRGVTELPKFCQSAEVRGVKPGAEVLAVRRDDRPNAPSAALLARQQFGQGFTAMLATDLLWRWKMSLPSGSRAVEKFWQQLLLSLSPAPRDGLRLVKLTEMPTLRAPVTVRVESAGGAPRVESVSPDGTRSAIALQPAPGESGAWLASFAPSAVGHWEVRAGNAGEARVGFTVSEKARTAETLGLPADVEGLRQLAESTGGALLGDEPAFRRDEESPAGQHKRSQPLWDSSWLLATLLGLYGAELLTRRWFRLL